MVCGILFLMYHSVSLLFSWKCIEWYNVHKQGMGLSVSGSTLCVCKGCGVKANVG